MAVALPNFPTILSAAGHTRRRPNSKKSNTRKKNLVQKNTVATSSLGFSSKTKDPVWQCVERCGACCKLEKGPTYPSPDEIFDDPSDVQLYKSLIGPDGWCINFEKSTRKCSIYSDRPYFCRVEPDIFETLYGISKKKFNKEACGCCIDAIKYVYGAQSQELDKFNHAIRTTNK
ncbi:hypothetical protein LguiA_016179 [Lonicera macranthoides]